MDYLNFIPFREDDFDEIIMNVGGKRYTDNIKIQEPNCDYILDDAVIELKIIEEEPLEKKQKQKKLIELFPAIAETVILKPSEEQKYDYYRILESPIKSSLKKASKQLNVSAKKINAKLKIAIIINNGLYMVSQNEFSDIAINRAKNDTSGIDILIIASIHYYSDKFDMRILTEFKDYEIKQNNYYNKKQIIQKLRNSWNNKIKDYISSQMININYNRTKEPIKDLYFESDGIRYVKPIIWGEKSQFWKNSRPREDSTKEDDIPIIFIVPVFNKKSYIYAKKYISDKFILKDSFKNYMDFIKNNQPKLKNKIVLNIYVELDIKDLKLLKKPFFINDIQQCANNKNKKNYDKIKKEIKEYHQDIKCNNFILVEVIEIGMDKANDITYISHITNNKQDIIIDGKRLQYLYAIELAIAICNMVKSERIYYIRNEDYKWK